jgi:hypothetical protein
MRLNSRNLFAALTQLQDCSAEKKPIEPMYCSRMQTESLYHLSPHI